MKKTAASFLILLPLLTSGHVLAASEDALPAPGEYTDLREGVPFFVCGVKEAGIKLANIGLNDHVFDVANDKSNQCTTWNSPAQLRIVPGSAGHGAIEVEMFDPSTGKTGSGWTAIIHTDFVMYKKVGLVRFTQPPTTLACTTKAGALDVIPTKLRGDQAGAVILSANEWIKGADIDNYKCFTIPDKMLGIAYWDTKSRGVVPMVEVQLYDEHSTRAWIASPQ